MHTQDSFTLQNTIPHYDLVVVDEMEGTLSHFNAKTLERKQETYDVLTRPLTESKNLFCLGWDLHNRSLYQLELELIQTQMTQKPMLRAEVGMRVRCANEASAECIMRGRGIGQNSRNNYKKRGICG